MTDCAIRVENLGKRYQLGQSQRYRALRDTLGDVLSAPKRWLRGEKRERSAENDGTFWALKDVSFEIKPGEVVGIIGRNGAGKSTLLKILSRITEPTEGGVDLYGRVGSLLEVGTGFHPELTGRENIYLNGAILGMKRAEIARKFDEIVAFAGIERFLDSAVKFYSSGMYTRLAFAVAAHLEPEILMVDEVLAVGDLEFQQKCLGKMSEVARSGRTVLFVSHNMAAIKQLCDRGILLRSGRLAFTGDVRTCIDLYSNKEASSGRRIVEHTTRRNTAVTVERVSLNGSEQDKIHLEGGQRKLTIELVGLVHRPIRASLQARLFDHQGTPLGIFSPGLECGEADLLDVGRFALQDTMLLPRLHRGEYSLMFELVHPNVEGWFEAADALRIDYVGSATATGQILDVRDGLGWFWLDRDESSLKQIARS